MKEAYGRHRIREFLLEHFVSGHSGLVRRYLIFWRDEILLLNSTHTDVIQKSRTPQVVVQACCPDLEQYSPGN